MDIVICVALKDCFFLRKNLYFIKKNLCPKKIYIITDPRNFRYLSQKNSDVVLLDENHLIDGLDFAHVKKYVNKYLSNRNYGWYFQQFLKLGFALSQYANDDYLAWDADTVPLNKISLKNENGQYLILTKKEHHQPYFNTIDNLFDAPRKADFSFIGEHMFFNVKIVREMLNVIENNSERKLSWCEQCIAARKDDCPQSFSEFETYGTYCLNYYPSTLVPRHLNTFRRGGKIFGLLASKKEIESLSFDLDTVSFELYDYPIAFSRMLIQKIFLYYCKVISKTRQKFKKFPF